MIVSPSAALLAAGVASGICFLLVNNLLKWKADQSKENEKRKDHATVYTDNHCACCLKPFLFGRGVECSDCGGRNCPKSCTRLDTLDNAWRCLFCHQRRSWLRRNERWFGNFGRVPSDNGLKRIFSTAKSQVNVQGREYAATNSSLDLATGGQEESLENVRDFVEKVVEGLLRNADHFTTPGSLPYNHQSYKPTMDTAPAMAHTALRELVERAVEETRKLPNVGVCESSRSQEDCDIPESGYEDVLATAILNKVIEKFQAEQVDSNSNVLYEKYLKESHSHPSETELGFDEGVEDGGSSLELQSQDEYNSDCSVPPPKYIRKHHHEPLSLTIEEQIEEVTTYTSDDEFPREKDTQLDCRNIRRVPFPELGMDIIDPSQGSSEESQDENEEDGFKVSAHVDLITPVESWEENWLFQKKRAQAKAEPVAMLVPSPSSDFKALIGDKDAEDTSDLSECSIQSDEEIEEELMEAINNVIPRPITEVTKHRENSKQHGDLKKNENHATFDETDSCEGGVTKTIHDTVNDRNLQKETFAKARPAIVSADYPANSGIIEDRESKQEKNGELSPVLVPVENARFNERKEENISELAKSAERIKSRQTGDIILLDKDTEEYNEENDKEQSGNEKLEDSLSTASKNSLGEDVPIKADNVVSSECISPLINNETQCESTPVEAEVGKCREAVVAAAEKRTINHQENDDTITLATPPRPGTIAEREHKKWENAPPIENNPYSEENIQKRLLQRQYSRKSADVPGINSEVPANANEEGDIILGTKEIDFTRFGRDYYINDGRVKIEKRRRSISSTTNRPESSLSQHSTGSDLEQERFRKVSTCETDGTEAELQNNTETNKKSNQNVMETSSEKQGKVEEYLERERKNSKNVINAKLNNREGSIIKSYSEDNQRKIRRIDLKAYGFENEINHTPVYTTKPRIVNRLNLKAFGYEGLRRTQSVNQLDREEIDDKSNIHQSKEFVKNHTGSGDYDLTKSSENIGDDYSTNFRKLSGMISAKSVPNIAGHCFRNFREIEENNVLRKEENGTEVDGSYNEKEESIHSSLNEIEKSKSLDNIPKRKLPMPSVRKLAEAFSVRTEANPTPAPRHLKIDGVTRERPTTPEIQIVESPKQMHSLTARSLSKEFREGLRQASKKVKSPPASHVVVPENQKEVVQSKIEYGSNDVNEVILPGKLKDNIEFWEQLQRKN